MKILHIVESFGGGVYDFIKDLTNGMCDYDITIMYGDRGNLKENFQNEFNKKIKFIKWENAQREISIKKDFSALKEIIKILKNNDYDVIHLHSSKAGFLGRIAGRLCRQQNKIIYTTHGISFLRKDISRIKTILYILFEKIGEICGGKTIACSKSEAEFIKNKNIKCSYINNGIKINEVFLENYKNKAILKIITVGRITTQKNPELFNKIAEIFIKNKNIKFIWVGDGELRETLKSKNIKITGWLSQDEVSKQLKEADIYLSTAGWEGLSLAVLQGMNYKLPLVLSECVGNVDLVKNNYNGFIYETKEEAVKKLNYLINNFDKIKEFGDNSYKLLKEEFDILNMIKNYKEEYFKIF